MCRCDLLGVWQNGASFTPLHFLGSKQKDFEEHVLVDLPLLAHELRIFTCVEEDLAPRRSARKRGGLRGSL